MNKLEPTAHAKTGYTSFKSRERRDGGMTKVRSANIVTELFEAFVNALLHKRKLKTRDRLKNNN